MNAPMPELPPRAQAVALLVGKRSLLFVEIHDQFQCGAVNKNLWAAWRTLTHAIQSVQGVQ